MTGALFFLIHALNSRGFERIMWDIDIVLLNQP